MEWKDVEAITFDCYGTLIDWESGILGALAPVLDAHGLELTADAILRRYARHEAEVEAGPFRSYRRVLDEVSRRLLAEEGIEASAADRRALADSLPGWPCFPDTRDALARLAARFRLGILSNVDDDLFAATRETLGVDLEWVVTAAQVGSYKPSTANFETLLDRVGTARERLVHAAQSLFHDVAPARALGIRTVWIDRRSGRDGGGATPTSAARPDLRVCSLEELADLALATGRVRRR